ncbi:hypothetical protein H5410_060825 [Solanum commersonii]|uniref:Uncharacterized protein n=1 Tax=Solanum commersonii TaxID=4109 RepID=A0A9J5W628_SOLCO|nr:hypothetical protein H5410_060825 [Solanum commersonii]
MTFRIVNSLLIEYWKHPTAQRGNKRKQRGTITTEMFIATRIKDGKEIAHTKSTSKSPKFGKQMDDAFRRCLERSTGRLRCYGGSLTTSSQKR